MTLFGYLSANAGDVNGDGVTDLLVGATSAPAVYIIFLTPQGTSLSHQRIAEGVGSLTATGLGGGYFGGFGGGVADLNQDGVPDVMVGAHVAQDVYILFLSSIGTVVSHQKISQTSGSFTATGLNGFGYAGAGVLGNSASESGFDVSVGAVSTDTYGAVYILFLSSDGTCMSHQKISDISGGLTAVLASDDQFGVHSSPVGDLNADNITDLLVGAYQPYTGSGQVYILFLTDFGVVTSHIRFGGIGGGGDLTADLETGVRFGRAVSEITIIAIITLITIIILLTLITLR